MGVTIEIVCGELPTDVLTDLANMLTDSVLGGASIGWTFPPLISEASAWWTHHIATPGIVVWIARDESGAVVGSVSLLPASKLNSQHRAEVMKLMVHRHVRGRGISRMLMAALETYAVEHARTLLVLDTETESLAEKLYQKWGWTTFGIVDDYVTNEQGRNLPCSFMLKRLSIQDERHPTDA
ncbi:MAG: GNAT family N-acetyltransferase [Thermomicrobiales bacterium]